MIDTADIRAAALRSAAWLVSHDYRGHDPYDGLESPLFRLPILRSAHLPRWAFQQVFRRSPLNLRPLLGIAEGYNPVTLALAVHGHAALLDALPAPPPTDFEPLLRELSRLRTPGFHGSCWGYDFDWEARYARIPRGTPTVVATGIITHALLRLHRRTGHAEALDLARDAVNFVVHDLHRHEFPEGDLCFSYGPTDRQRVINASLKGARLIAHFGALDRRPELTELALRAGRYAVRMQRADGAWPYAVGDARSWADNFHTGYVLDALDALRTSTGTRELDDAIARGWGYYRTHFFESDGTPKYYDQRAWPLDATAGAQAILTLLRFGDRELAQKVARLLLRRLGNEDGSFAFRDGPFGKHRTVYARWSVAWMFAALAECAAASR